MKTINVALKSRSYPIWLENGALKKLSSLLQTMNQNQTWVIFSQKNIYEKIGKNIHCNLKSNGYKVVCILLDDGEQAKTFTSIEKVFSELLSLNCDRSSTFIALGGGVVGDVCGFIASTFMRGTSYIQIPTTLLAMVDSSIGGKTGINLPQGKNLVGAFWQPQAVVIDPDILITLPKRELSSAMGEIIKYGVIANKNIIDIVFNNMDDLLEIKNPQLLFDIIYECAKIKAEIIISDEYENDRRRILNFGHTIGHALETFYGFKTLRHGEAIAYGMMAAGRLSIEYAQFMDAEFQILEKIIMKLPLPKLSNINSKDILNILQSDKKNKLGNSYFILLNSFEDTIIVNNVKESSIVKVLESL